jgi:hypothetical protein
MSMYGLVNGQNPHSDQLLALIGLTKDDFHRFRDAFVEGGENGAPEIHAYTRSGGGNRDCSAWTAANAKEIAIDMKEPVPQSDVDCDECEGVHHPWCSVFKRERLLQEHPLYLTDVDDEFDRTYATFKFRVPVPAVAEEFLDRSKARGTDAWPEIFANINEVVTRPEVQAFVQNIVKALDQQKLD